MSVEFGGGQYLSYIAFTRPGRYLYISYPSDDNAALGRSQFVTTLMSLFEGLKERYAGDESESIDNVHSESELAGLLCTALGGDNGGRENVKLNALLNAMRDDEQLVKIADTITG